MAVLLPSFIDLLKRFVKDLHDSYGRKYPQLEPLRKSVLLLASASPETCAQMFDQEVAKPYGERIKDRDESFFLSDGFIDTVNGQATANESYLGGLVSGVATGGGGIQQLLQTVRAAWLDMGDVNKEHVWGYLAALTVLSERMTAANGRV